MAFPKFDTKKHPHGFHGHFAPTGAAALFGLGASRGRLHAAAKKPMAPAGAERVRAALALAEKHRTPGGHTEAGLIERAKIMYGTRRPGESDAAWAKRVGARVADVRKLEAASNPAPAKKAAASTGAARAKMASSGKTPQQHIEALRRLSGDDAAKHAAGIKGKELDAALQHTGVSRSGTVAAKRERLVAHAHGAAAPSVPPTKAAARGVSYHVAHIEAQREQLRAGNLEAAHATRAYVAGVKGAELDALAKQYGVHGRTAAEKRQAILSKTVIVNPGTRDMPAPAGAGGARAKMAAGRTGLAHLPDEAAGRLKTLGSTAEAEKYLAKATKADLTAVADKAGVSYGKSWNKAQIQQALIQHTVGRRLDSATISRPKPAAPAAPSAPRMSDKPLIKNTWGSPPEPGDIHFHDDGAIGMAIKRMGQDAHLEVEGDALGNVLGHIATGSVMGRISSQQQLDRLKQVRDKLPRGTKARQQLDDVVDQLDAPNTPIPAVPAGALAPLKQLMTDLHAVPLMRRDPSREQAKLTKILNDFAPGKVGGLRMLEEIRKLRNQRHESTEGKFEIDRAVGRAVKALEDMVKADGRQVLYPPARS